MRREDRRWLLATIREAFREDGPREDRLDALRRGERPDEEGEGDGRE